MPIDRRYRYGKVAYDARVACHGTDCQPLSGCRTVNPTAASDFVLLRGHPKIDIKTAERGTKRAQAFCPNRGTPIYMADADDSPIDSLRIGAIRPRTARRPSRQIWCRSARRWSIDSSAVEKREAEWHGRC